MRPPLNLLVARNTKNLVCRLPVKRVKARKHKHLVNPPSIKIQAARIPTNLVHRLCLNLELARDHKTLSPSLVG